MDFLNLEKCLEKCSVPSDSCSASLSSFSDREEDKDYMEMDFKS